MTVNELLSNISKRGYNIDERYDSTYNCCIHYADVNGLSIKIEYIRVAYGASSYVCTTQEHDYAEFLLNIIDKSNQNSVLIGVGDFDDFDKKIVFREWDGCISAEKLWREFGKCTDDLFFVKNFTIPKEALEAGEATGTAFLVFNNSHSKELDEVISQCPQLFKYTNNGRIKEMRLKHKLTQQQFSDVTKVPKRTIENWEGNKAKANDYMPDLISAKLKEYFADID